MITYQRSAYGINLLLRVHGSAVYRGAVMGSLSVGCFILMRKLWSGPGDQTADEISHPYAVGVLVATLTFLLVFRAQSAYSRYWEAATSVYHMVRTIRLPNVEKKRRKKTIDICVWKNLSFVLVLPDPFYGKLYTLDQ
jgi:predicted membrane chloride channel (bestrophin family)